MTTNTGTWLYRWISACLVLFALAVANPSVAQRYSGDSRTYVDYGEQFHEKIVRSADGSLMDVLLNAANSMFSFTRSSSPSEKGFGSFYAIREFSMELTEHGFTQPLMAKTVIDTIRVATFEETTAKDLWHPHVVTVALPKLDAGKHYDLHTEARDLTLHKLMATPLVYDIDPVMFNPSAGASDSASIGIGDVTFMENVSPGGGVSMARGVTYPFSRDVIGSFSIKLARSNTASPNIELVLRQVSNHIDPADTGERSRFRVDRSNLTPDVVLRPATVDSVVHFHGENLSHDSGMYLVTFRIPGAMLQQGFYRLQVNVDAGMAMNGSSNRLKLAWIGMPLCLDDPHDAAAALIHILPEDSVKAIQSGSKTEVMAKLFAYWKTQDPTPATAYNERMATFCQRVDYAYFNFSSGRYLDGALTDRGKIYILFGPPSKTERTLLPGEYPVETWTYTNNVKKVFRFLDKSSHGEYKLIDVRGIS